MPKIVHLSSVHPAFDSRIFDKECRSLANAGYKVSLVIAHDRDEIIEQINIKHIRNRKTTRLKRVIFSTWQVYKRARQENADLYHFHDAELIPIAILLRLHGKKIIYDVHEDLPKQIQSKHYLPSIIKYPLANFARIGEWLASRIFFNGIIGATPDIARKFPSKKTIIVQNFPRLENLSTSSKITPYSKRKNIICYIGGISKERAIFEMVAAMPLIGEKKTRLLIAGSFFSNKTKQEIKQKSAWEKVDYLGHLNKDQIVEQLNKSRCGLVILHPTKAYLMSYPVKMFEYMAQGLPIIVSDFALWRKILEPYNCAIFINPLKANEISSAIEWILQNENQAEEMGKKGKKAVELHFNWQSEENKLLSFYKKLLA